MKIYNLRIQNVDYRFNKIQDYFKDNYPETVHFFLLGSWYKVYNEDAKIVSEIFNYKMFENKFSTEPDSICCGFPEHAINKITNKLEDLNINYAIIKTLDYSYTFYDFEELNCYRSYYNYITDTIECGVFDCTDEILDEKLNEDFNKNEINKNLPFKVTTKYDTCPEYKNIDIPKQIKIHKKKSKRTKKPNIIGNSHETDKNISSYVQAGDTVTIQNMNTGEKEQYTIIPTYKIHTPVGFSGERGKNFGKVKYKEEFVDKSDVNNNKILSESEFGKNLLGTYLNSTVLLFDEDLSPCKYKIIDIQKH